MDASFGIVLYVLYSTVVLKCSICGRRSVHDIRPEGDGPNVELYAFGLSAFYTLKPVKLLQPCALDSTYIKATLKGCQPFTPLLPLNTRSIDSSQC